ncbi:MAG: DUF2141 domain-containing protein [Cyanobacteria bacterium P01_D01_bin.2]
MDRRRVLTSALVVGIVGSAAYPVQGQIDQTTLVVELSGLNDLQGQICLNLFASSAGFPSDRDDALRTQCVMPTADPAPMAIFDNLIPGSYAVSVFHDANGDNEFNRNFVGMPEEGFGFSRNPEARTGPPEFGDAVILVAGAETRIEIELSYF